MMFKRSFSARLTTSVLIIVSALFIISISIVSVSSRKILEEEAIKLAESKIDGTVWQIESVMDGIEATTSALQWSVWNSRYDEEALYRITRECIKSNSNIVGCAIAFEPGYFNGVEDYSPYSCRTADGGIKSFQLASDSYDYHLMDWYQIPRLLLSTYWTDPYYDEGGGNVLMTTFSRPLSDENGKMYAILTADLNLQNLRNLANSIKPFPNSSTIMTASDGSFIVHPNQEYVMRHTPFSIAMENGDEGLLKISETVLNSQRGYVKADNSDLQSFVVYSHLKNDWTIAISCPLKDVMGKKWEMINMVVVVILLGLILLIQACRYSIRQQTEPILKFANFAEAIADNPKADESKLVLPDIKTQDEIFKLKDALARMQISLKDYSIKEVESQRIQSELSIATGIQMGMLPPKFKESIDLNIDAHMHPAKEVGGDLYDYYVKDRKLYFCIGDVSGKGVPASMIMAITINAFRYLSKLLSSTDKIMTEINDSLSSRNETNLFVTLFIGILDLDNGELMYCNGGHNPLVTLKKDGTCEYLHTKANIAVGLFEGFKFESEIIRIERGDTLFLYTDGVTEAENTDKNLFGEEMLLSALSSSKRHPASLIDTVSTKLKDFTAGAVQSDDITMLAISYK